MIEIKKNKQEGNKIEFLLYLVIVFIFRLPSVYFFPIKNNLTSSWTIASLIIVFLFFQTIIKKKKIIFNNFILTNIVIIYFFSKSISIITANNVFSYLLIYKRIIFSIMFLIISLYIIDSPKKIIKLIKIILLSILINIALQLIIYFQPKEIYYRLGNIMNDSFWNSIELERGISKFFIQFFDFSLFPLFGILYLRRKTTTSIIILYSVSFFMIFLAIISNFRILFIIVMFNIFMFFIILIRKKNIKNIMFLLIILIQVIIISQNLSNRLTGTNSISRFFLLNEESINTIKSRIYLWKEAVEIGLNSPIFGVGLGNYYDNLPLKNARLSLNEQKNQLRKEVIMYPHNIFFETFSETGIIGLIALLSMLLFFIIQDIVIFKGYNKTIKLLIISFWSLFISSLTGPRVVISYYVLFWLLRALIVQSNKLKFTVELMNK